MLSKTVFSQINGEFWWLHEKFAKLQQVEAPQPKFDDVNEFDTDESAKIIFKNNELSPGEVRNLNEDEKISLNKGAKLSTIYFRDQTELSNLANEERNFTVLKSKNRMNVTVQNFKENNRSTFIFEKNNSVPRNKSQSDRDELVFVFPESNEIVWEDNKKDVKNSLPPKNKFDKNNSITTSKTTIINKVRFQEEPTQSESESICTFITQQDCVYKNGIIHPSGLVRYI